MITHKKASTNSDSMTSRAKFAKFTKSPQQRSSLLPQCTLSLLRPSQLAWATCPLPANTSTSMKPASSLPHWPVSLLLALQIWAQPTQPHFGMDCGPSSWRSETSRSCQIPQGKAPGKNTPAPSTNQYFDSGVGQGDCSTPE